MSDDDETTNKEIASLSSFGTGLNSRTQSYASVTSSQFSRQSRLPEYDFGEDDRPGVYKSGKKQKNKDKPKDKGKKESKEDGKAGKDKKGGKKSGDAGKRKERSEGIKSKESKDKKKNKKSKAVDEKDKSKVEKKKIKNEKKGEEATEKHDDSDKKEKSTKKSENDSFLNELNSAVGSRSDKVEEDSSMRDMDIVTQSDDNMTSRESSVVRKKTTNRKKGKNKKTTSRGRSSSRKKQKKENSRKRKKSKQRSTGSDVEEVTSVGTDSFRSDTSGKKKKIKKKPRRGKKSSKKDGPTVITVNDDTDDEESAEKGRKLCLGIIPVPSKREPFVYSCCMCCSLGAGSLLTGIIFLLFSIAYLVVRGNEMKARYSSAIWAGKNLLPDVWRLLLVAGMLTASLCLLASLVLIVASCLWGQKEHYKRLRRCIRFWIASTAVASLINISEAVYVQAMPNIVYKEYFHSSDSVQEIKLNATTFTAMTAIHTVFFLYLVLVLISYLRLLKYMDSPKIGTTPKRAGTTDTEKQATAPKTVGMSQSSRRSIRQESRESTVKTVDEVTTKNPPGKPTLAAAKIPDREDKYKERPRMHGTDQGQGDRIYENTSFAGDSSRQASQSSLASEVSQESGSEVKKHSFKDVLDEIVNDDKMFDNMFKPRPLKRMPTNSRRPPVQRRKDEIYMNCNPEPNPGTSEQKMPSYSQVRKPLKRTASLSSVRSPLYDSPPVELDRGSENLNKSESSSKDTGIHSIGSTSSPALSTDGSHPQLLEMERLAEKLKKEQEALDKAGNCDPAVAENLTQMALNALKLSEKILQDVKSNERKEIEAVEREKKHKISTEAMIEENKKLAAEFFDHLSRDPNAVSSDPIEEMFRMYGRDLCSQNPEMVNRYLHSYKTLQEGKSRQQQQMMPRPGNDIAEIVMNEQKPWMSILNPSEAIPSPMAHHPHQHPGIPPTMFHQEPPSAFSPVQPTQSFHAVSHAPNGPPLPVTFNPVEYPMQNSASYNHEPPGLQSPQRGSIVPYKAPLQFDPKRPNNQMRSQWSGPKYYPNRTHPESAYYDDECPYSCCYTIYDDYGSIYGSYGPYPYSYSDCMYGEVAYGDPNWYPMGDPAYSMDPYYNPYEVWDEPAPPYTEKSSSGSYRGRRGSKGYDSKTESSSRGYDGGRGSRGGGSRTGANSKRSRSLPDLLDESMYSDGIASRPKGSKFSVSDAKSRTPTERTLSRGSGGPRRSASFSGAKGTDYAYLKGYKAALREALATLSSNNDEGFSRKRPGQEEFIEKLISQTEERSRSKSFDRTFSGRTSNTDRTTSFDSRKENRELRRESGRSFGENSAESRSKSRASRTTSRLSRASGEKEVLPSFLTRKTSKLSFRPASRPGQPLLDDVYDDYRSTSSVPPRRNEFDDFGLSRKSSQSSTGFRNLAGHDSVHSEDIMSTFELMSSHGGRPSTRSRLSDATYPYSDGEGNFYNTLNLDDAYPDKHIPKRVSRTHSGRNSAPIFDRTNSKGRKSVLWYMGDDETEPIYRSDYDGIGTGTSFASSAKQGRSSSFSYKGSRQDERLESFGSSKRKVTFGNSPQINRDQERRISWN